MVLKYTSPLHAPFVPALCCCPRFNYLILGAVIIMDSIVTFVVNHWFLSGLFVVILLALIQNEREIRSGSSSLTPQESVLFINRENALVLDVRDVEAFKKGHIVDSLNIPGQVLQSRINELTRFKDRPILVVGPQAMAVTALKSLKEASFIRLKQITGGIEAWKSEGLPLVKK